MHWSREGASAARQKEPNIQELFPVAMGLLLGAALGVTRPAVRLPSGIALALALGVLATIATGEFQASWSYVLIDIPVVATTAALGLIAARRLCPVARGV